jgi:hypothetical protein
MAFVALVYGWQTCPKGLERNLYANVLARRSSVARRILVGRARTRQEKPSEKLMPLSCSAIELLQQNLPHPPGKNPATGEKKVVRLRSPTFRLRLG